MAQIFPEIVHWAFPRRGGGDGNQITIIVVKRPIIP
jgi:hypothetical protein